MRVVENLFSRNKKRKCLYNSRICHFSLHVFVWNTIWSQSPFPWWDATWPRWLHVKTNNKYQTAQRLKLVSVSLTWRWRQKRVIFFPFFLETSPKHKISGMILLWNIQLISWLLDSWRSTVYFLAQKLEFETVWHESCLDGRKKFLYMGITKMGANFVSAGLNRIFKGAVP